MEVIKVRVREGETCLAYRRRPRFYSEGRDWYFRTREDASIGPFNRLSEAVDWAADYAAYIQTAPTLEEVVNHRSIA